MHGKATLFGRPLHPLLVAIPIAFYATTLVGYAVSAVTGDLLWFHVGIVANIGGVLGAAVAAVPGFIDWAFGIPSGHPAKTIGVGHMLLNVTALTLFAVDAVVQYGHWSDANPSNVTAVVLAGIGVGLTLCAGFLGLKMVQTFEQPGIVVNVARPLEDRP